MSVERVGADLTHLQLHVREWSMLSINVFRGASEQHCFKKGVWRAILIQTMPHLDSIVAQSLLVADFIDSIDPEQTLEHGYGAVG
jgi:hypothetical protein